MTLDALIRRIVREEVRAALATAGGVPAGEPPRGGPPLPVTAELGELVGKFLGGLAPGERAWAGELYRRWLAWAGPRGVGVVSSTAFGRLAGKSALVERHGVGRRWYVRRSG